MLFLFFLFFFGGVQHWILNLLSHSASPRCQFQNHPTNQPNAEFKPLVPSNKQTNKQTKNPKPNQPKGGAREMH
jgi:hypothetical protein